MDESDTHNDSLVSEHSSAATWSLQIQGRRGTQAESCPMRSLQVDSIARLHRQQRSIAHHFSAAGQHVGRQLGRRRGCQITLETNSRQRPGRYR